MEVPAYFSARLFVCALLLGAVFGLLDHLFRLAAAFLQMEPHSFCGSFLQKAYAYTGLFFMDIAFFAICAAVSCCFFYLCGDGRPRGFAICAMLLTFCLYRKTLGRLLIFGAGKFGRAFFALPKSLLRFCASRLRPLRERCKNAVKPIARSVKAKYNRYKSAKKKQKKQKNVLLCNGVERKAK